jgi:RNA polymerase sigma-B factor
MPPLMSLVAGTTTTSGSTRRRPLSDTEIALDQRIENALADLEQARRLGQATRIRRAEEAVIAAHLPTARRVARRFAHRGADLEDLEQQARMGLVQAVRRWRPENSADQDSSATGFARFAIPTMEGCVKRWFRDHLTVVRRPRTEGEAIPAIRRATEELVQRNGGAPTADQIAAAAGLPVALVRESLTSADRCNPMSLDSDDFTGNSLGGADENLGRAEMRGDLARAWSTLTERERRVLALHYWEDLSQARIGQLIGVSQMQVSRILAKATRKLADHLVDRPQPVAA